jgi:ABC-2 type transport system permease protein
MQAYLTLVRRELSGYFGSLAGYITIAAVLFLLGMSFNDMLSKINGDASVIPVTEYFFVSFYFWVIFLLTTPVMTIRSFAGEKSSGTYETLMTAPVKEVEVVLAKFSGAVVFYVVTWLPFLAYLYLVRSYSNDPSTLDLRLVSSTFLGIVLVGSVYMAMGCFASALTGSQIVAAMISYALGLTLFLLSLRNLAAAPKGWAVKIYGHMAMIEHLEQFARGVVETQVLVYYLSLTVLFLFLTCKVIETRRWK